MTGILKFALIGKSGSGKSEVARILSEMTGCRVVKTGAICRQIAFVLFGNDDKRSTQMLDDALTTIDPSIFVRAALRNVGGAESVVIDALRFLSDAELAADLGCLLIRVDANQDVRLERLAARGQAFDLERDGAHRTETELDEVTVHQVVINNGSKQDLRCELVALVELARR